MLKNITILSVLISLTTFSQDDFTLEKRRKDLEKFNSLIKSENFNNYQKIENLSERDLTLNIKSINLQGNNVIPDFQMEYFLNSYIEKNVNIYELINDLENKYIEKGYVTTRVGLDMEKSDINGGNISLFVLEGKIDKVFFNGKENKLKTFLTFPQKINNELNINDLDQGIDNLANAKMDIKANSKGGYSDIYITKKEKYIGGSINFNDLGQKETGRYRLKYNLDLHNILGLNENIDFSYQMKLQRQKKDRDSKNFSFNVTVPFKYWSFNYAYDSSEYLRTIPALGRTFKATGTTENQSFGLRKVVYRNQNGKLDLGTKIVLKNSKNYIDDVQLTTSSRHLSVLTVDTSYVGRVLGGLLSSDLALSIGLKRFSANKDNEEWYREEYSPKAQFRKYNLNISWYRPINKFYYKVNFGGQYSKDILYSQEKLGIGDDTTVRGFKDESTQGDKGFYLRNEIGYKPNEFLEPYIAYDYGRIFNNKVEFDKIDTLQGVSAGLKVYFKNFEGSFGLSKPIDKPTYFKNNKPVIYTSLTYRF